MKRTFLHSKIVRFVIVAFVIVVALALVGGGWYFSGVVEEDGLIVVNEPDEFRLAVTAITDDTITLKQLPDTEEDENLRISAVWGVTNGNAYGQLGDVVSDVGGEVTREYTAMVGQLSTGEEVFLERTAFPHDPLAAHGLKYEEVVIPGSLGGLGAWHVAGSSDTWAILVHGRTSNRETSLKLLDDLAALGLHSLTIDYRNDEGAPASESGYYDFGTTEWEDIESAVRFALDNGAEKIVLIGYSMGGGVVVSYQLRSEFADLTTGIVLDAPMLNFGRTIDKGAEERGVPAPITLFAKMFTESRFGIDWDALDFLSRADELAVPILLFHGDDDDTVPIETSVEFAAAAPSFIEFHTFKDVGHVKAWNSYPERYESLFRTFIERVR
jgi:hypothetical protein